MVKNREILDEVIFNLVEIFGLNFLICNVVKSGRLNVV